MNGTPTRRPKSAFSETGVRIKEVSEGRPCDNCPELCPGFISHSWRSQAHTRRSYIAYTSVIVNQSLTATRRIQLSANMCMSLKQMEWAEIYRRVIKSEKEDVPERKIQKFPSRERNHAVRRKSSNNNLRSHANCQVCAKVAQEENR